VFGKALEARDLPWEAGVGILTVFVVDGYCVPDGWGLVQVESKGSVLPSINR
jgi:hypothetical protein